MDGPWREGQVLVSSSDILGREGGKEPPTNTIGHTSSTTTSSASSFPVFSNELCDIFTDGRFSERGDSLLNWSAAPSAIGERAAIITTTAATTTSSSSTTRIEAENMVFEPTISSNPLLLHREVVEEEEEEEKQNEKDKEDSFPFLDMKTTLISLASTGPPHPWNSASRVWSSSPYPSRVSVQKVPMNSPLHTAVTTAVTEIESGETHKVDRSVLRTASLQSALRNVETQLQELAQLQQQEVREARRQLRCFRFTAREGYPALLSAATVPLAPPPSAAVSATAAKMPGIHIEEGSPSTHSEEQVIQTVAQSVAQLPVVAHDTREGDGNETREQQSEGETVRNEEEESLQHRKEEEEEEERQRDQPRGILPSGISTLSSSSSSVLYEGSVFSRCCQRVAVETDEWRHRIALQRAKQCIATEWSKRVVPWFRECVLEQFYIPTMQRLHHLLQRIQGLKSRLGIMDKIEDDIGVDQRANPMNDPVPPRWESRSLDHSDASMNAVLAKRTPSIREDAVRVTRSRHGRRTTSGALQAVLERLCSAPLPPSGVTPAGSANATASGVTEREVLSSSEAVMKDFMSALLNHDRSQEGYQERDRNSIRESAADDGIENASEGIVMGKGDEHPRTTPGSDRRDTSPLSVTLVGSAVSPSGMTHQVANPRKAKVKSRCKPFLQNRCGRRGRNTKKKPMTLMVTSPHSCRRKAQEKKTLVGVVAVVSPVCSNKAPASSLSLSSGVAPAISTNQNEQNNRPSGEPSPSISPATKTAAGRPLRSPPQLSRGCCLRDVFSWWFTVIPESIAGLVQQCCQSHVFFPAVWQARYPLSSALSPHPLPPTWFSSSSSSSFSSPPSMQRTALSTTTTTTTPAVVLQDQDHIHRNEEMNGERKGRRRLHHERATPSASSSSSSSCRPAGTRPILEESPHWQRWFNTAVEQALKGIARRRAKRNPSLHELHHTEGEEGEEEEGEELTLCLQWALKLLLLQEAQRREYVKAMEAVGREDQPGVLPNSFPFSLSLSSPSPTNVFYRHLHLYLLCSSQLRHYVMHQNALHSDERRWTDQDTETTLYCPIADIFCQGGGERRCGSAENEDEDERDAGERSDCCFSPPFLMHTFEQVIEEEAQWFLHFQQDGMPSTPSPCAPQCFHPQHHHNNKSGDTHSACISPLCESSSPLCSFFSSSSSSSFALMTVSALPIVSLARLPSLLRAAGGVSSLRHGLDTTHCRCALHRTSRRDTSLTACGTTSGAVRQPQEDPQDDPVWIWQRYANALRERRQVRSFRWEEESQRLRDGLFRCGQELCSRRRRQHQVFLSPDARDPRLAACTSGESGRKQEWWCQCHVKEGLPPPPQIQENETPSQQSVTTSVTILPVRSITAPISSGTTNTNSDTVTGCWLRALLRSLSSQLRAHDSIVTAESTSLALDPLVLRHTERMISSCREDPVFDDQEVHRLLSLFAWTVPPSSTAFHVEPDPEPAIAPVPHPPFSITPGIESVPCAPASTTIPAGDSVAADLLSPYSIRTSPFLSLFPEWTATAPLWRILAHKHFQTHFSLCPINEEQG